MRVDEIQILLDQGRIALNQGRFDEASELIDRVLAEDGQNEQALNLRGLLFFKQERFREAVDLFQNLVDKYPEEPTLLMNLGLAYLKSERYDEAVRELNAALERNPNNPKILNYLGLAHSGIGRLKDAQSYFVKAGSTKMAEQMLQLMKEKSGESTADDEEIEIDADEISAAPSVSAEDTIDKAFGATFNATEGVVDTPLVTFETSNAEAVPTTKEEPLPSGLGDSDESEISMDAIGDELLANGQDAAPTDLLGSAVALLKDRYEAVLETAAAGKNLRELAKLLELTKDKTAALDHVRTNIFRFAVAPGGTTMCRLAQVLGMVGDIRAEPKQKRYKGKDIKSIFGGDKDPVFELVGTGDAYVCAPPGGSFFPLHLDRELVYIVEDVYFGMTGDWRWENGRLPGKGGNDLHLVQLRGEGAVALQLRESERLASIELSSQKLILPVTSLAGWYGNIVPVLVDLAFPHARQKDGAVQFQGDGTVLVRVPSGK